MNSTVESNLETRVGGTVAPSMRPRVVFIGCVKEGREALSELLELACDVVGILTFNEEMAQKTSGAVSLDDLAASRSIPLYKVQTTNNPESVEIVKRLRPDVVYVVGWTRLVSEEILSIPKYGCIGMHASLLPKYRGRAPVNWALINNESHSGNSMILLDDGVDTGKVLAQKSYELRLSDTCATVYDMVAQAGRQMIRETMPLLATGDMPNIAQDESQASVMPKRTPEDGVIDWSKSALELFNWVRALTHPYPGAFTHFNGKRLFIWDARIAHYPSRNPDLALTTHRVPGTIISTDDGIVVAVGKGELISLHRLNYQSEEELSWRDFQSRYDLRTGQVLGHINGHNGSEAH